MKRQSQPKAVANNNSSSTFKRFLIPVLLGIPIVIFCLPLLMTGNLIAAGDNDYLIQTQEAMRRSILEFHQFPWWNPWVSGGVPLFANPQFGLISIITPFTLLFGSIFGYKLAIMTYLLIGFFGLRSLFRNVFKTPELTAILLGYIWSFGTFLTYRAGGGHYTFLVIQFFPWALKYYFTRNSDKWAWLKLGLILGFMALTAAHNITILSYLVLLLLILIEARHLFKLDTKNKLFSLDYQGATTELKFLLKAGGVFVVLSGYRLFYTLQYMHDYPRIELHNPEPTIGVYKGFLAMFAPFVQYENTPKHPQWSWLEASVYIGFLTLIAALIVLYVGIRQRRVHSKQATFNFPVVTLASAWFVCFILAMGNFIGALSPYQIMRHLPFLGSLRVASRWLVWCSLFTLFFIAIYKARDYRRTINVLLAISCVELFLISSPFLARSYVLPVKTVRPSNAEFQQKEHYNAPRNGIAYDENLTEATRNNYGQIIAGDSLIDTRWAPPIGVLTKRCSVDDGCPLVLTNNAKVVSWSPNKVVLSRTGDGEIRLNMNPGKYWLVNNRYAYLDQKTVNADVNFIIKDTAKDITIQYRPRLSVEWAWHKVF